MNLCAASVEDDAVLRYDDLVVAEKLGNLRAQLEARAAVVGERGARCGDLGTAWTLRDRYACLCQLQGCKPCAVLVDYLDRQATATVPPPSSSATSEGDGSAKVTEEEWSLNFDRCYLGRGGLLPILLILPHCASLRSLSLREQRLTSGLVKLLCEALRPLTHLTSLDLAGNPLGSKGVQALLMLAHHLPQLVRCDVRGVQAIAPLRRRLNDALRRNCMRREQHACALWQADNVH